MGESTQKLYLVHLANGALLAKMCIAVYTHHSLYSIYVTSPHSIKNLHLHSPSSFSGSTELGYNVLLYNMTNGTHRKT